MHTFNKNLQPVSMTYWNSSAFRRSKRASAFWWGRVPCDQRLSAAGTFLGRDLGKKKYAFCSAICYRAKIRCEVPNAYLSRALRSWDDPFVYLPWFSEVLKQEKRQICKLSNCKDSRKNYPHCPISSSTSGLLEKCIRNTLLLSNIK